MNENFLPLIVAVSTWLTQMPPHSQGLLVTYGSQHLIEVNAQYRGYDLSYYKNRCGVSAISPSDIGKVVWLRVEGQDWYGPCLTVDAGARRHFYHLVYVNHEIAEVPVWMAERFKFPHGSSRQGEVFRGLCPPHSESIPEDYAPPLLWDEYGPNPYFKIPDQQIPVDCFTTAYVEGR